MNIKYLTTKEFKKMYGTKKACFEALLRQRMPADGLCFKCPAPIEDYYHFPLHNTGKDRAYFLCTKCMGHFHPMVHSIFDHTHVPIEEWFAIMFELCQAKFGMAATEIARKYGYSNKTAYGILEAIREMMGKTLDFNFYNTIVEVDESFIRTGTKGLGRHFKQKVGRGSEFNTNIFVIAERQGRIKLFVIPSSSAEDILPIIEKEVDKTTMIFTDEWPAYSKLKDLGYDHALVNHSDHHYVTGSASTNTAEGIFSKVKRVIKGTYGNVSERKLQGYLNEIAFRHNNRIEEDYGFHRLLATLTPLGDHYHPRRAA